MRSVAESEGATAPDYRAERSRTATEHKGKRRKQNMAVDASGVIYPVQDQQPSTGGSILSSIESHPYVSIFIGLIVAVAIGYAVSKLRGTGTSSTTSTTTNAPGTDQGLPTTDAQGNKVYYVPTSNTFLDYNNVQDSYNPNNSVATSTVSTVTNTSEVNNGQAESPPPSSTDPTTHYIGSKPLIPYGQYKGPNYSNLKANTHYTYNGVNYRLSAGAGGRLWGTTPWGATYLLYGPSGYYGSQFQTQNVTVPAGYPAGFNPTP